MYLKKGVWYYDFRCNGKRYNGTTGFHENQKSEAIKFEQNAKAQARVNMSADMLYEQQRRRITNESACALDADAIWTAFSKVTDSGAGQKKMKAYRLRIRAFCDWMKQHYPDVLKVSEVDPRHAQEYFKEVRGGIGSNSTKNEYLMVLKYVFKTLGESHGIIKNPFDGIKKLTADIAAREAFTPEELKKIGDNATGWLYSLCLTALSTGLREGDICMLRKSSVNLSTGWISIPSTRKTGASVDIPILPGLRAHLEEYINDSDSEYVYPELADIYTRNPARIGKTVKRFFEDIGIAGTTQSIDGYARRISAKDVHSFRHTFVYLAAVSGVPFPVVQGIVGHTSPAMTKHYMDHASREAKAQYLAQIPAYLTGSKKREPKPLTPVRVRRILTRLTAENLERCKARLFALLDRV